jgi:hypothetical protein
LASYHLDHRWCHGADTSPYGITAKVKRDKRCGITFQVQLDKCYGIQLYEKSIDAGRKCFHIDAGWKCFNSSVCAKRVFQIEAWISTNDFGQ